MFPTQDRNKRSPLHWAASQGFHEYVKLLLKNGAKISLPDVEGKTPLHWASSSGGAAGHGMPQVEVKEKQEKTV